MYLKIIAIGNLGRDPNLRLTPAGTPVCTLNVATNRTYKDANGQQVKETTWLKVSVFGKMAEACAQYLTKGRLVAVEGRLTPDRTTGGPRLWTKTDGTPGASFEVFATQVKFLDSGNGTQKTAAPANVDAETGEVLPGEAQTVPASTEDDQSMPF